MNATLEARVRELLNVSWQKAREAVHTGKVFVDGERQLRPELRPAAEAKIEVRANAPRPLREDEIGKDQVLYEDDAVIVVNKPALMETVPFSGREQGTLLHAVRQFVAKRKKGRPDVGIVHRLDKETSGVMMFTLTHSAKQNMADAFRKHTVERVYWALTAGIPPEGRIETHIAEDRGDRRRGSVEVVPGKRTPGQKAVTWVTVKERYTKGAWVECKLETGRTHQIRIHLSESNAGVLGEFVYADLRDRAPRLMLHAHTLGFTHPINGKTLTFTAPPPADFSTVKELLRKP